MVSKPTIEGVVGYCFNVEHSSLNPDEARAKIRSLVEEYAQEKVCETYSAGFVEGFHNGTNYGENGRNVNSVFYDRFDMHKRRSKNASLAAQRGDAS